MKKTTPLGPLMIDCEGTQLSSADKDIMKHPLVGGVILFSRNYQTPEQLKELCGSIHSLRDEPLLIAVDHEGGRVQRFKEGFTEIPCMEKLGILFEQDEEKALHVAQDVAWLLAAELSEQGVDFSFTPVLDLNYGMSDIIGNRAFSADKKHVARIAMAFQRGLKAAGMVGIGKHFPGHGAVVPDSHVALPIDNRSLNEIMENDVYPFQAMVDEGMDGIMPAHIIYQQADSQPAGFSEFWLQDVLRKRLGFKGVIFSDDLTMEGASIVGGFPQRARAALAAGCDMALICNNRMAAEEVIDDLSSDFIFDEQSSARLSHFSSSISGGIQNVRSTEQWKKSMQSIQSLGR